MWNILIVIIIAVVIWAFNPLAHLKSDMPVGGVSKQTRDEVNQVQNDAIEQVNRARMLQQQEQQDANSNQ